MAYRESPEAPRKQLLQLRAKLLAEIDELRKVVGERSRPIRGQGLEGEIQALGIERDRLLTRAQFQLALRRGALINSPPGIPSRRWPHWLLGVAIEALFSLWP